MTPTVLIVLFASTLLTIIVTSHLIVELQRPLCPRHFALLWHKLKVEVRKSNPVDGSLISNFVDNLDQHSKMLLLLGSLPLPFDQMTVHSVRGFITSAVGKIYNMRTERHRSQVGFGFVFMVSDSDSQFCIRKSNTKLENLKVILWCFKEN